MRDGGGECQGQQSRVGEVMENSTVVGNKVFRCQGILKDQGGKFAETRQQMIRQEG